VASHMGIHCLELFRSDRRVHAIQKGDKKKTGKKKGLWGGYVLFSLKVLGGKDGESGMKKDLIERNPLGEKLCN